MCVLYRVKKSVRGRSHARANTKKKKKTDTAKQTQLTVLLLLKKYKYIYIYTQTYVWYYDVICAFVICRRVFRELLLMNAVSRTLESRFRTPRWRTVGGGGPEVSAGTEWITGRWTGGFSRSAGETYAGSQRRAICRSAAGNASFPAVVRDATAGRRVPLGGLSSRAPPVAAVAVVSMTIRHRDPRAGIPYGPSPEWVWRSYQLVRGPFGGKSAMFFGPAGCI